MINITHQSAATSTVTHYRDYRMVAGGQIEPGCWWPITRQSDVTGLRWPAVVRLIDGSERRIL